VEELCVGETREAVSPPPLSTSPSLEDPDLGGLHSLPFCCPSNGAQISLSLSLHPRFLTRGVFHLLLCGILGQGGLPCLAAATPKTLRKIASAVKR
jgi:hypothetical protein